MRKSYIPKTYVSHKSKNKKAKPSKFILFLEIITILIFMAGILYLAYSPTLNLVEINVQADDEVLQKNVRSKAKDFIESETHWWYNNRNIFLLRTDKLEQSLLKEFPQIKSVELKRNFNRYLDLKLDLRTPIFSVCEVDTCYNVSDDGINIGVRSEPEPIIRLTGIELKTNAEPLMSLREIQWLKTIVQEYSKIDSLRITELAVQKRSGDFVVGVFLYTEQGYYIMLDLDTDVVYQAEVLKQVFDSRLKPEQRTSLEYIDLRIKDRVYYKFK